MPDSLGRAGSIPRWIRSVGWQGTSAWVASEVKAALGFRDFPTLTIKPRHTRHPVIARLRGSSDMNAFSQVFAWDEYACLRSVSSPRWILDLGANVGYSSAFSQLFSNRQRDRGGTGPGQLQALPHQSRSVWDTRARANLAMGPAVPAARGVRLDGGFAPFLRKRDGQYQSALCTHERSRKCNGDPSAHEGARQAARA